MASATTTALAGAGGGRRRGSAWRRRGRGDEDGGLGAARGAGDGGGGDDVGVARATTCAGDDDEEHGVGAEGGVGGGENEELNENFNKSCIYSQSFGLGSWHQPGLMHPFSPGWCHQSGPKISFRQPKGREAAAKGGHWSRLVPRTGTNATL